MKFFQPQRTAANLEKRKELSFNAEEGNQYAGETLMNDPIASQLISYENAALKFQTVSCSVYFRLTRFVSLGLAGVRENISFVGIHCRYQCLREYMPPVLRNGAGGFQSCQPAQGCGVNLVANTLIATLKEIFLHRLAHLQQHPLKIHLMVARDWRHGQLHDDHRRASRIVFDRALA